MPITPEQRQIRDLKKHLRDLTSAVKKATTALDNVMKGPSTSERGQSIAKITNFLEMNNELALRFALGAGVKKSKFLEKKLSPTDNVNQRVIHATKNADLSIGVAIVPIDLPPKSVAIQ